jgi:predicted RNase H-like HicB family nuclease
MNPNLKLTAVFVPAEEGGYMAYIKEIRGVITQGETIEEAQTNLLDALELMLSVMREDTEAEDGLVIEKDLAILI